MTASDADAGALGLPPGAVAPELNLPATPDGQRVQLADFRGKPVVLVFYPADFTPVCGSELAIFSEILPDIEALGARLFAISCDSVFSHRAFAAQMNLKMPLLSDFHPKGEVARQYGVYDDNIGMAERALFVVDSEGTISWSYVSPIGVNPGADGILTALEAMAPVGAAA